MDKKILGLDLGTNSIGWALIQQDFEKKLGNINGLGSRIIPMSQDVLGKFESGVSISQTAERTGYRGVRRLYQRDNLRRERLHRVLNVLGFLPTHYAKNIDFEKHLGQFIKETKLNYSELENGKFEFLFMDSFNEMLEEFKKEQPELFYKKANGKETKIPLDWTIYYLRKKALTQKISKEELAWLLLNFNQKRGYYQLREENSVKKEGKTIEIIDTDVVSVDCKEGIYTIYLSDGYSYVEKSSFQMTFVGDQRELEIISEDKYDKKLKKEYISVTKKINFLSTRKVINVIDSKEVDSKGLKTFIVKLDNGNEFKKKKKNNLNWSGKYKTIQYSYTIEPNSKLYISAPEETNWGLTKKKTEQDVKASGKTVGEYIYETLLANPTQKIRGKLIKTIERKFYKEELKNILDKQIELQPELFTTESYQKCIEELYPRNEAHQNNIKDKGFSYLFLDDIIFYQRPLKSKKSTISGCQYESRTFFVENKETGKKEKQIQALKVIPKSHPLFIEFRMWQFLRNLKIYHKQDKKNVDITSTCIQNNEEWCDLFDFLMEKKEVEQKHIIEYFVKQKRIEKTKKDEYRWNYQEGKKLPMNETKAQFISRFKKVAGFDLERLTVDFQIKLWHIIYSVKDKNEFIQALKTFANKNEIDVDSFVERFKAFPPYKSEYGAYSQKAIKKLLPLMRIGRYWNGNDIPEEVKNRIEDIKERLESINYDREVFEKDKENRLENIVDDACPKQLLKSFVSFKDKNHLEGLNTYQACYAVYEQHSEVSEITQWKTSADIDRYLNHFKQHSLRNPIVEQVITETLRTVRDIWNYYGEGNQGFFNEIHVELGRDMKNSAEKRKNLTNRNAENERTNLRIKELLKELKSEYAEVDIRPYSPSHQEILKIYEEGVSQNPKVKYDKVSEEDILKIRKNNSPKPKEIEKYKLWLEQGYISPYTGQIIPLSKLFTEAYQIEHIIPQSRYFDNSLSNKIICESAVNQEKSNKTAYEYLKENGGSVVELGNDKNVQLLNLNEYEAHCGKYFKKNRTKLNNLLSEDIPEGFIERQMNDSRYIAKVVKSLLSNIVREDGEKEATSKNLLPTPGGVTSRLKHNWGLNDKWNELIAPRFKRLNEMTNSNDFGYWDKEINAFRTQVPDEVNKKGFNKKRIDHRHHALDALVIACTTRDHTHYLHSLESEKENYSLKDKLLIKNENEHYTKNFQLPWASFPVDAKNELEKIIVSFKQNLRVINKTNNKTWQWVEQKDGKYKKELVKQNKGKNWAIRKPLHAPLPYGKKKYDFNILKLADNFGKIDLIINEELREKSKNILSRYKNISEAKKQTKQAEKEYIKLLKQYKNTLNKIGELELKRNPNFEELDKLNNNKQREISILKEFDGKLLTDNDLNLIQAISFRTNTIKYRKRQPITQLANRGQGGIKTIDAMVKFINKVSDRILRLDLLEHLKNCNNDIDVAFSIDGIDIFNSQRKIPVYRLPISEESSAKFPLGDKRENAKVKFGEAEGGTNLFFAVYWDEEKQKRNYETIPLNEVIQHQKDVANLPTNERALIQPKATLGNFRFTLSPNDLVYVPNELEMENPNQVDFNHLTKEQVNRIYKMVSSSGNQCFFIKNQVAQTIVNKLEYSALNKMEKSIEGIMIKSVCWKLKTDRLGNIIDVIK